MHINKQKKGVTGEMIPPYTGKEECLHVTDLVSIRKVEKIPNPTRRESPKTNLVLFNLKTKQFQIVVDLTKHRSWNFSYGIKRFHPDSSWSQENMDRGLHFRNKTISIDSR